MSTPRSPSRRRPGNAPRPPPPSRRAASVAERLAGERQVARRASREDPQRLLDMYAAHQPIDAKGAAERDRAIRPRARSTRLPSMALRPRREWRRSAACGIAASAPTSLKPICFSPSDRAISTRSSAFSTVASLRVNMKTKSIRSERRRAFIGTAYHCGAWRRE